MDFDDIDELFRFLSDDAKDPANPLLPNGYRIGNWQVLAYLGGGGFGEVYRVKHIDLDVIRALKLLKSDSRESRARFMREVLFVAQQTDSKFPRFYEYGTDDGRPYLIMELLEPRDLPRGEHKISEFMLSLCETCKELHKQGFVHRDIKPSNILYRPGSRRPILVDFGLLKEIDLSGASLTCELTEQHRGVGTSRYAAPEQLAGEAIADVADVHSLGVLADECFCRNAPKRWSRIIQRATTSLPEQRYASVSHLERAIRFRNFSFGLFFLLTGIMLIISWLVANEVCLRREETCGSIEPDTNPAISNNVREVWRDDMKPSKQNSSDSAAEWL